MTILSFRNRVIEEAFKQKALREENKPIPLACQKYARLSGLLIGLAGSVGAGFIWSIGIQSNTLYVGVLLFMLVVAIAGLLQLLSGRHILTRR